MQTSRRNFLVTILAPFLGLLSKIGLRREVPIMRPVPTSDTVFTKSPLSTFVFHGRGSELEKQYKQAMAGTQSPSFIVMSRSAEREYQWNSLSPAMRRRMWLSRGRGIHAAS